METYPSILPQLGGTYRPDKSPPRRGGAWIVSGHRDGTAFGTESFWSRLRVATDRLPSIHWAAHLRT